MACRARPGRGTDVGHYSSAATPSAATTSRAPAQRAAQRAAVVGARRRYLSAIAVHSGPELRVRHDPGAPTPRRRKTPSFRGNSFCFCFDAAALSSSSSSGGQWHRKLSFPTRRPAAKKQLHRRSRQPPAP